MDRLRSLPITRLSVLTGRALADTVVLTWGTAVTSIIGFAVGFRAPPGRRRLPRAKNRRG